MFCRQSRHGDYSTLGTEQSVCEDRMGRRPLKAMQYHTGKVLRLAGCQNPAHILEATATPILYSTSGRVSGILIRVSSHSLLTQLTALTSVAPNMLCAYGL